MRDTKRKIAFFTVPEYEREQKWLEKQHKSGWKLIKATVPFFYKFKKCEPEEVVYQLDYNEEGLKHKDEYVQMFKDCGWEYITEMMGYSYFRKPVSQMNEKEEIFSDDDSKMDMIGRVFKGRMIPLFAIFFLIIIPQLTMRFVNHKKLLLGEIVFWIYVVMFVLYITVFVQFAVQYARLKKKMRR